MLKAAFTNKTTFSGIYVFTSSKEEQTEALKKAFVDQIQSTQLSHIMCKREHQKGNLKAGAQMNYAFTIIRGLLFGFSGKDAISFLEGCEQSDQYQPMSASATSSVQGIESHAVAQVSTKVYNLLLRELFKKKNVPSENPVETIAVEYTNSKWTDKLTLSK